MGLDLGLYNVKSVVGNVHNYYATDRLSFFNNLNCDYDKFYVFEELIEGIFPDDWEVVHMLHNIIGSNKTDLVDKSSEHNAIILNNEDLKLIIEVLQSPTEDILSFRDDASYWYELSEKLNNLLTEFDFSTNTLIFNYDF